MTRPRADRFRANLDQEDASGVGKIQAPGRPLAVGRATPLIVGERDKTARPSLFSIEVVETEFEVVHNGLRFPEIQAVTGGSR